MTRTIRYVIPKELSAQSVSLTIKGFLKAKSYSVQNMKQLKQDPRGILLNGVPAHLNTVLAAGDLLTICIQESAGSENILPVALPLDIVYEDEDLLVLNKPAGMPIHPSQNNRDNTLANALAYYFQQQGTSFTFRCINRLDRDTSGLTIVAKHFVSAGILGGAVSAKSLQANHDGSPFSMTGSILQSPLQREYLAIVHGAVTPEIGTIDAPLGRKPGSIIERCVDLKNGERAITHYRVLEKKNGYSLVSLRLETGRTHQIRIHMKSIGHPLVGDYLYKEDTEKQDPIHRQALHSHTLSFIHPITGDPMHFSIPLPDDMVNLLSDSLFS